MIFKSTIPEARRQELRDRRAAMTPRQRLYDVCCASGPRWKDQTTFYDPETKLGGNCTQAAVASLLGLGLSQVPDFNKENEDKDGGHYWHHLRTWFASLGWQLLSVEANFHVLGLHLADGKSERGCYHFVLYDGDSLLHDPHPSRAGLIEVRHRYVLLPFDPAKHPRQL